MSFALSVFFLFLCAVFIGRLSTVVLPCRFPAWISRFFVGDEEEDRFFDEYGEEL